MTQFNHAGVRNGHELGHCHPLKSQPMRFCQFVREEKDSGENWWGARRGLAAQFELIDVGRLISRQFSTPSRLPPEGRGRCFWRKSEVAERRRYRAVGRTSFLISDGARFVMPVAFFVVPVLPRKKITPTQKKWIAL